MEALGFKLSAEAVLRTLTDDVVKSSEIEGEKLDAEQVRSSVARQLGIDAGSSSAASREPWRVPKLRCQASSRRAATGRSCVMCR
jgi:hypothetical protein